MNFLAWMDRRHFISVRAFTLYCCLWMTWKATEWAFDFAYIASGTGIESAAIIGAVTAPVCALQVLVFKFYMDAK